MEVIKSMKNNITDLSIRTINIPQNQLTNLRSYILSIISSGVAISTIQLTKATSLSTINSDTKRGCIKPSLYGRPIYIGLSSQIGATAYVDFYTDADIIIGMPSIL